MVENRKSKTKNQKLAPPFWQQLRWNLPIAAVALAVLPVVLVSYFTLTHLSEQAEQHFTRQLEGIATLKQDQITRWLEDSGYILDVIWAEEEHRQTLTTVLVATLDPTSSPDEAQLNHINQLLAEVVKVQALFEEFLLYNAQGRVVAASDPNQIGKILNRRPYFANSLEQNFIQPPHYEVGFEGITMFMTRPLSDSNGQTVGVLAGRLDMKTLGQIMTEQRTGLGQSGETYLVSPESHYLVTPSRFAEQGYSLTQAYYSEGINRALQGENGAGLYDDYRTPPVHVIGVYRWLPDLQVAFVAEIDQAEALAPFIETQKFSLTIAILAALAAVLVGLYSATRISRPVAELTQTAHQIAAGDLTKQARISRLYEIGLLASAFNTMTKQLSNSIKDLEQRFTELQQMQRALQASETRSRALIEGIPDMIFRITAKGLFLDFKAAPADLAMPAEEIIGSNLNASPLPSPVVKVLLRLTRLAIETNQLQTYEYELSMPNGLQIYESRVVKSGPNEVIHVVRNITERTQMEKSLRESEERYARMVRGSSDGVWEWNILTGENYLSPRWKEILGYEDEEVPNVRSSFLNLLHPDDKPRVNEAIESHLKEQTPYREEIRLRHKDGTYRWVLTRAEAVRDDEGRPIRMAGSITDITERKQAEESLAKSEARLAEAQRIAHVGSWERDMQTDTAYWSDEHYRIFGLPPKKVAPPLETFLNFIHPDDRFLVHRSLQELSEQRKPADMSTYRIVRPDGEIRIIDSRREITFDEAGQILRVAGIIQDVTERKQAEEKIAFQAYLLQNVNDAIFATDRKLNIISWNKAAEAMYGWQTDEVMGRPIAEIVRVEYPDQTPEEVQKQLFRTGSWVGEAVHKKRNGSSISVLASARLLKDSLENIVGVVGISHDITERKAMERELQVSEQRFRQIFARAPISIWEEDFSAVGDWLAELRTRGVHDLDAFLQAEPQALERALGLVRLVDVNDTTLQLFEVNGKDELVSLWTNLFTDDTFRVFMGELRAIWEGQNQVDFECSAQTAQGRPIHYLMHWVAPLEDGRMNLRRVIVAISDITERKQTEQELREAHQLLDTIFDHTHMMVAYMDAEFNFIQVNRAYAEIDDQEPSYFPGKNHFELYPHPENEVIFRRVVETKEAHIEFAKPFEYAEHPDRGIRHWDWSLVPVKDANEAVTGVILTLQNVTERIKAEELLKEQEMLMEIFFSQSLDGFFFMMLDEPVRWDETVDKEQVIDYVFAHQRITKVNDAMLAQYGATREQFLNLTPGDFFAHDIPQGKAVWRSFLDQGRLQQKTDERKFDGSSMWIEGEYVCIYDYQGRITGHFGIQREITDQVQAEEALRQSEARLAEAQRIARLGNWDWNVKTQDFYWSDEIYRIFGLIPQELEATYEAFLNIVHPADREYMRKAIDQALADKTPYSIDYRIVLPDGEVRIIHEQGEGITDEQDQPIRMLGTVQDITERKRAEQKLIESEKRYRTLFTQSPDGIMLVDPETTRAIEFNPAMARLLGYSNQEFARLRVTDYEANENPAEVMAHAEKVLREGYDVFETRMRTKEGNIKEVQTSIQVLEFSGRTIFHNIIHDLTERKRVERALRASEEKFRVLVENSPDMIMTVDQAGTILFLNRTAPTLTLEDVLGTDSFVYLEAEYHERYRQAIERVFQQEESDYFEHISAGLWLESRLIPLKDDEKVTAAMVISTDITERKQAEEALRVSERRFRAMVEQSPFSIVLYSPDGCPTMINQAFADLWQVSPEGISHLLANYNLLKDPHLKEQGLMPYIEKGFAGEFCQIPTISYDPQQNPVTKPVVKNTLWIEGYIYPIINEDGQIDTVVLMHHDITKQSQAEEALRESEGRLRRAELLARIGHFAFDADGSNFVYSDGLKKIWDFDPGSNPSFNDFLQRVHPNEQWALAKLEQAAAEMRDINLEFRIVHPDGTEVAVHSVAEIFFTEPDRLPRFFGTIMDITERKRAEEQIKASLQEKEILLKEIHHRVKNNMQIISSLLDLQADMVQDKRVHDLFKESKQRIRTMALIHERLYQSQDLARIDFLEYVEGLTDYLLHSYETMVGNVTLDLDITPLSLSIETAIPCGLIINELVSNAFKHAFPNGKSGKIHVSLSAIDHLLKLQIHDNGIGFPTELNPHRTESLGLTMVMTLIHQLKATIEMKNNDGVQIEMIFSDPTVKIED